METPPIQPTQPPAPSAGPIISGPVRREFGAGWFAARVGLAAGSIVLLVLARDRFGEVAREPRDPFDISESTWLLGVLLALAAGVLVGLALVLPGRRRGYRSRDLLAVGVVPALYLITAFAVIWGVERRWNFPALLDRAIYNLHLFSFDLSSAVAALLGVVISVCARGDDLPDAATGAPAGS